MLITVVVSVVMASVVVSASTVAAAVSATTVVGPSVVAASVVWGSGVAGRGLHWTGLKDPSGSHSKVGSLARASMQGAGETKINKSVVRSYVFGLKLELGVSQYSFY